MCVVVAWVKPRCCITARSAHPFLHDAAHVLDLATLALGFALLWLLVQISFTRTLVLRGTADDRVDVIEVVHGALREVAILRTLVRLGFVVIDTRQVSALGRAIVIPE